MIKDNRIMERGEMVSEGLERGLKLPASNIVHIDVDRLQEIIDRYERDRYGFFTRIPRLR